MTETSWQGRLHPPASSKEARFRRVAEAVAALVAQGGTARVTPSAVARRAGVSRPWLYKYLGADREALLTHATSLYAAAFADLGRARPASHPEAWREAIGDATRDGLRDAVAAPWCVTLYFRHRHAPDPVGRAIRDAEARHVDDFLADLPPGVRGDPAADRRFVVFFTATRLGAYHRWLDPAVRAACSEEDALREVLRPLDQWLAARSAGR